MVNQCFFCAALFLVHLALTPTAAGTSVTVAESIVILPDSTGNVQSTLSLLCLIEPAPAIPAIPAPFRWVLPSGATVNAFGLDERFAILVNPVFEGAVVNLQAILLIEQLSYLDAGAYICEFDDENGETLSATVELILEVDLQVVGNQNVTVSTEIFNISLSCEMSLYLRPDEDLQWFHDGRLINNTADMERYTTFYFSLSREGQLSRVSTLVITEPQLSDSGTYTCAIRNTALSQDTELTVVPYNISDPPTPDDGPPPIIIEVAEVGFPGNPPGTFSSSRGLGCLIKPRSPTFETEWILPDGSSISSSEGRFTLVSFVHPDQVNLLLAITAVSYYDEGVYTCRFRDTTSTSSNSKWISNTTEILLPVLLGTYPINQGNVHVSDNVTDVSLSCEMSLYLRPDENQQWFRGGQQIMNTDRHTITYTDGTGVGQIREDTVGSSRISTLVISEPRLSDSGTYTCAIINTEHSQDIELTVEEEGPDLSSEDDPTTDPTVNSTVGPTALNVTLIVIYSSSGAALLIIALLMMVAVLCIVAAFRRGKRSSKKPSDDNMYDYIPEGNHSSTAIALDYNPAYDSTLKRDEQKGDRESNLDSLKVLMTGQTSS